MLEVGTLIDVDRKVGMLTPSRKEWVILKVVEKRKYYTVGFKGAYQAIGCVSFEAIDDALAKGHIEVLGKIDLEPFFKGDIKELMGGN